MSVLFIRENNWEEFKKMIIELIDDNYAIKVKHVNFDIEPDGTYVCMIMYKRK